MALARGIALTVAALAGGGCGASREPVDPAAQRRDASQAPQGTLEAIEEKLAELEQRLKAARIAVRTTRHAKESALRKLAELERDGRDLRRQLESARQSGARTWTDIERAIDSTLVEIETATGLSEE
jgi:chromosome segregation ATPase